MSDIEKEILKWIENVVIGLSLCPFARKPFEEQQVRIQITNVNDDAKLLEVLQTELVLIDEPFQKNIETTLIVLANYLQDFYDYNQFLDLVDQLLEQGQWTGKYQIATFHPDYQFAGTEATDLENLTNRSPYPILQILSEKSLSKQLELYPNPEQIPEKNIARMNAFTEQEKMRYFPYLFHNK